MLNYKRTGWYIPAWASIGLGIVIGSAGVLPSFARPALKQRTEATNPQEHALNANFCICKLRQSIAPAACKPMAG